MAYDSQAWAHRRRLLLFLLSALSIFGLMYVLYSAVSTLRQLNIIEADRDTWQRPADVLGALDLREGNVVADLGSGAGYFTLKLSPMVGPSGKVLAVDLRKLSLSFLWIRAALRTQHNIHVIVGETDDPHLPAQSIDAVLISNTYHEFEHSEVMLDRVFQCLRAGGRLVIVDRNHVESTAHEISLQTVAQDLRAKGFEILSSDAAFIDRPGDDHWWLMVARKTELTQPRIPRSRRPPALPDIRLDKGDSNSPASRASRLPSL